MNNNHSVNRTTPWNKGKLIGQKPPLKLPEIWSIRISFYLGICYQDLQQANLAEDIISREISILERYKDQPGCEAIRLHDVGAKSLDQGVIVVWDTTRQSKTFLAPDGFVVVGELGHCP